MAIVGTCVAGAPGGAPADNEPSRIDPDGTLHVRELTLPPSDLWSAQFKAFHVNWVAGEASATNGPQIPARNAPQSAWDKYDASVEESLAGLLAQVLERYPVDVEDTKIAGVRVGILSPKDGIAPANRRRVLINLHSGGFWYGRGLSAGQIGSAPVASIGRIKVVTVDYRQAPLYGYPSASEDVEAVYRELLKTYKPEAIGIFGCSAGGALTAQAVAWFQSKGLPRPGAVGIFCSGPSPRWVSRQGDSGIWLSGGRIPRKLSAEDRENMERVQWYMEGADSSDPQAYPESSTAVLARFPPTLLLSGTRAFEMSSVIVAHAQFLKLGVDSSLYIMEGAPHGGHMMAIGTPEAHDANAYIAHWFDSRLKK